MNTKGYPGLAGIVEGLDLIGSEQIRAGLARRQPVLPRRRPTAYRR
jgi:hypothetical protein